jgi:hypothetical protein
VKVKWIRNGGGRQAAGFKSQVEDCVCRAIVVAGGKPSVKVYRLVAAANKLYKRPTGARNAVNGYVVVAGLRELRWESVLGALKREPERRVNSLVLQSGR